MNDPSSPAPLVEQALQELRDNAPDRATAPGRAAESTQATSAPGAPTEPAPTQPAPKTQVKADRRQAKQDPRQRRLGVAETEVEADAASSVKLEQARGNAAASVGSALDALRTVSVSAQTRLADPTDLPELPSERDLSDLGPYVEHVMREARAAAAAYRKQAARETTARATELLDEANASAETIRQDADAYSERARAQADALLAERVHRIAELTGRLSRMAQLAGDEFAGDHAMRDQMMQFISGLTAAAEETVAEVFPNTKSHAPS